MIELLSDRRARVKAGTRTVYIRVVTPYVEGERDGVYAWDDGENSRTLTYAGDLSSACQACLDARSGKPTYVGQGAPTPAIVGATVQPGIMLPGTNGPYVKNVRAGVAGNWPTYTIGDGVHPDMQITAPHAQDAIDQYKRVHP